MHITNIWGLFFFIITPSILLGALLGSMTMKWAITMSKRKDRKNETIR